MFLANVSETDAWKWVSATCVSLAQDLGAFGALHRAVRLLDDPQVCQGNMLSSFFVQFGLCVCVCVLGPIPSRLILCCPVCVL